MNTKSTMPDDNALLAEARTLQSQALHTNALDIFRDLLTRHGKNERLLHLGGTAALQAGQTSMAITWFLESLSINPNQADTQCNLGVAYWNLRDFANAESAYRAAIRLDEHYAEAFSNLCMVMQDGFNRPLDALELADKALEINPDYADAHNNRGNILQTLERFDEALAAYDCAISLKPDLASAHNNRGNALRKLNRYEDAIRSYRQAIALKTDYAEAHCNMGCTLADLGDSESARHCYQHALSVNPDYAKAHFNLAALADQDLDHDLALNYLNKSIALDPNFPDAYWNKSLLLLLRGKYKEGFELYERGWQNKIRGQHRGFKQPLWLGKQPLAGKRLLIHQEQGIGDCIHYARYVEMAVAAGAEVILETVAPLIPLLRTLKAPCTLVALGEPLPQFDCYIPLMSLPLAFSTTLENLPPSKPYLFTEKSRYSIWAQKLGPQKQTRVGLVWSGSTLHKNDHNRSLALKELLPVLALPLEFHCLQKEIRDADAQCLPALPMVHTHDQSIKDFADSAALVQLMDLVISVDTSVAHLAGALGKPTWILLPKAPDWRWLLDRADSPWYPSVRLFRQAVKGDWAELITRLRQALEPNMSLGKNFLDS